MKFPVRTSRCVSSQRGDTLVKHQAQQQREVNAIQPAANTPAVNTKEYNRILAIVLTACAILPLGWLIKLSLTQETLFPDFFGLWSFGRYVLTHPPASIYHAQELHAFQVERGMPTDNIYSFYYPPWILLLLAPFGALPYALARGIWLVLTGAAYGTALTAWRWQRPVFRLLLLAPSTAVCLLVGQNGFVTAALMLSGNRLLSTYPLAAGALLAVLACKPQLAILVPVLLLCGRHWRAIIGAVITLVMLTLATTLAFGLDTWNAWLTFANYQAATLTGASERDVLLDMMPTVTAAVRLLGGGVPLAHLAQGAAAFAGLFAVWRVRTRDDPGSRAVLPLATIIATPYAFAYDLPMVTGAILAVIAARMETAQPFRQMELPLLLACISAPAILPGRMGAIAAAVPVVFALTLWVIVRQQGPHPPVS